MLAVPVLPQLRGAVPAQPCRPISGQSVPSRGCTCQGEQPPAAGTSLGRDDNGAVRDDCGSSAPPPSLPSTPRGLAKPSAASAPGIGKGTPRRPGRAQRRAASARLTAGCTLRRAHGTQRRAQGCGSPLSSRDPPRLSQPPAQTPSQPLLCSHSGLQPQPISQAARPLAHPPAPQHPHRGLPDQ